MRRLRIGIIDLVTKGPANSLYGRVMNANLASIMPQVLGVWCEEQGHDVTFVCYTGFEDLRTELPARVDLVFIGAFTQSAQLAYALSALCRSRGAVTVLGGKMQLIIPPGQGHNMWAGFFQCQELVDFVIAQANRANPTTD